MKARIISLFISIAVSISAIFSGEKVFVASAFASNSTAILVNGGASVPDNGCDFYNDLHRMERVLNGWNQIELAADGDQTGDAPNGIACLKETTDTAFDSTGFAILKRYQEPGAKEASEDNLKQEIFKAVAGSPPPKTLLLYFTDHGSQGEVNLWGQSISAEHLQTLLAQVPEQTQLIVVHDHCFSASMLESLFSNSGHIRPHSCGFAAASDSEFAMEDQTIAKKLDGESAHNINAPFREMMWDPKVQSTPTTTSDVFLAKYLKAHSSEKSCETCLKSGAIDSLIQGFDDQNKQVAKVLLLPDLQSLNDDLARAFAQAKVAPGTSLTAVQAQVRATLQAFNNAQTADGKAFDRFAPVMNSYVVENLGRPKFDQFNKMDTDLDTLRDKLEFEINPEKRQDLIHQIQTLEPKYAELNGEIGRIKLATGSNDTSRFEKFVAAGAQKGRWPSNIFAAYADEDQRVTKISEHEKPILTLSKLLTKKEALDKMISNGDSSSILEYLGILECENTDLRQHS